MRKFILIFLVLLSVVCLLALSVSAYEVTLIGKVNDNFQIVTDNNIYEVKNNAAGDDMVINYVGKKVRVVGNISETRKFKIKVITVESFEVIKDSN